MAIDKSQSIAAHILRYTCMYVHLLGGVVSVSCFWIQPQLHIIAERLLEEHCEHALKRIPTLVPTREWPRRRVAWPVSGFCALVYLRLVPMAVVDPYIALR